MDGTLSLVLLLLFLWCLCSRRMERFELTAPAAFVLLGLLLGEGTGVLDLALPHETVKTLAEITLVWVLFTDAARLSFRALRPELGLYVRLLGVGLPLCVGLGALLAAVLLPGVSGWSALYVGAALAPTDAALGATMMVNPVVPAKIRRIINVESGLNDGIATPLVVLALAGAAAAEHHAGPDATGHAVVELAVGAAYGAVLGLAAGWLLRTTLRNGWAAEDFMRHAASWPSPSSATPPPSRSAATALSPPSSPAWRSARRTVRPAGAAVRRAVRGAALRPGLAGLRRCAASRRVRPHDLAGRGLRRPEPDGDPYGAGGAVSGRQRAGRPDGGVHRLVRPPRTRLDHLRSARGRGTHPRRGPAGPPGDRLHRPPQRPRPRPHLRPLANRYGAKAKDLAPTGTPPQDLPVRGMAAGGLHHWRRGGGPSAS